MFGQAMRRIWQRGVAAGTLTMAVLCVAPEGATAQNLFAPAALVNDAVVTRYEVEQRLALLEALGSVPSEEAALDALINERLQLAATRRAGVVPDADEIDAAMREFAARGQLEYEDFIAMLESRGVAPETFRDFITAGVAWRNHVRERFIRRVNVPQAEVDKALSLNGPTSGLQVRLSEIFLPARDAAERARSEEIAAQIAARPGFDAFTQAAREISVAPSRETGGEMPWTELGDLPPVLAQAIDGLVPGEVTPPLSTGNAIGIFQLRGIAESSRRVPRPSTVDYATYAIPGGRSPAGLERAARVASEIDTCDDLYRVARGQPESVLERHSLGPGAIAADVALELAKLDPGEASTALTRDGGQTLVFLMLCGRSFADSPPDRDAVLERLRTAQLQSFADRYLAELRANATILQR